jgi:PAS domain S-box-containing protein
MHTPLPPNEEARLAAVHHLGLLDTPPEERFDRITRLAQRIFDVPIALLGLTDAERQWFKSCQGLTGTEVPRSIAFCAYALLQDDTLIIPDTKADPRFAENPLVTGFPHARFYAGRQLRGPGGESYGTLCLIDTRPRDFSSAEEQILTDLAACAESELNNDTLNQALASQRQGEQYRRALMENIGDGIITFDGEGAIEAVNPAAEQIFGYPATMLIGEPIWTLIPRTYPREPIAGLLRALSADADDRRDGSRQNAGFRRERRGVRRDGDHFPAELTVSTMDTAAGRRYIASVRDISERRAAEAALRASETRLKAVISNLPIVLITTDEDGVFTLSEGQGLAALGRQGGESVGRSLFEMYGDFPAITTIARRALDGEAVTGLVEVQGASFQLQFAPLRDDQERVTGLIGVATNITERVRAEHELRETLAALAAQYDDAEQARSEAAAVLDAAGEGMALIARDRRFLTINRRFTDLFAIGMSDVVGRRFEEFAPLVARVFSDPAAFARLVAGSADDVERQFTVLVSQQWPEPRELQLFSTPVRTASGRHLGRLYVFRDVTREREVDRMKTDFVSLVSHELRTPLTSIKGFVDLLLDGEAGAVNEEQHEFLEIVKSNADRLIALINDILDVSRIESGRIELRREPLDLARTIRGVAGTLTAAAEGKGQSVEIDLDPALPPIAGDPNRVTQIISNLLTNAHKYTPRGGTIRIAAARDGAMARVEVQDSGVGLTPDEQAQIFTKFFRARNRATQEAGGTGLGLAITRSLVEMHGGEITLASTPGEGSTFIFTLPLTAETTAEQPQPAPIRWGKQILLLEPERDIADLIRRYLERAGYRVAVAADETAAHENAAAQPPDLLLLDLDLPGGIGHDTLTRLSTNHQFAATPILTLSIRDDRGAAVAQGVTGRLSKPVDERLLLAQVHLALAKAEGDRAPRRVLVADPDQECRTLLAGGLRWGGYAVTEATSAEATIAACQESAPDLLFLAARFPDRSGLATLQALRADAATRAITTVVLTDNPDQDEANRVQIEALGATLQHSPCLDGDGIAALVEIEQPRGEGRQS